MSTDSKAKNLLVMLLIVILFVIGCLFIYWAIQYWVYNNFDRARYEMSKIQPPGGGDSWALWKLDRRTGQLEYCSIETKVGQPQPDFTCLRARTVDAEGDNMRFGSNPPPAVAEPTTTVVPPDAPAAIAPTANDTPAAAPATPATPAQ